MLEERFKDIQSRAQIVEYDNFDVSNDPLKSAGYADCVGVAMVGARCALSHYDATTHPEKYLDIMIRQMLMITGATVIGGDPDYSNLLIQMINDRSIPLLGWHVDGWEYNQNPEPDSKWAAKSIVIDPATREIIMYSDSVGYVLFSNVMRLEHKAKSKK